MVIQYASDLHLEFPINQKWLADNPIRHLGDVLVLAGDVIPFAQLAKAMDYLKMLAGQFEQIYWIPGNHEYYRYAATDRLTGSFEQKILPNLTLLNNRSVLYKDTRLLFTTLWSRILPEEEHFIVNGMADFRLIQVENNFLTAATYNQWHVDAMAFLEREAAAPNKFPTIAVTHHVPTYDHYPKEYKNSPLSGGFATELRDAMERFGFDFWIYGHHHRNVPAFRIGRTQLVTNQLGYVWHGENKGFDPKKIIIV